MKVLVALGTRPEVIKLAPVIEALRARTQLRVCTSGQHREMLRQALDAFSLQPDIMLDTMSPGQSLNILASRQLEAFDQVLAQEKPDWVLVQGDTTTAFCAGLAAFHRGVRVGHVEAGLRTGDLQSPFPEEANRSLLSRFASLHFAPTNGARQALLAEGITDSCIRVTGNTVVDAVQLARNSWRAGVPATLPQAVAELAKDVRPLVLVTCHRRENFGDVMDGICHMLQRLCAQYPSHRWVFPVHLNPAVREPVICSLSSIENLLLLDPVDYHASLYLISRARLIVSDSGGIQEEAPSFGVPVVVMREHTERMEGVRAGFATLAGQHPLRIEEAVRFWLDDEAASQNLKQRSNPYGDGHAALRIASALLNQPMDEFHG